MAMTDEGTAVTEAHRRAQLAIRARALRALLDLWPMLNLEDLEATFPPFSAAAEALIQASSAQSAGTAAAYYRLFRETEGVAQSDLRRVIIATPPLPKEQVVSALLATSVGEYRAARSRGATLTAARQRALVSTSGSTVRLSLSGGRNSLASSVQRDPRAVGYARVSDGKPCYFCALLVSRGAVYTYDSAITTKSGNKYHDACGCTMEPIYSRTDYKLPGKAAEFKDLYNSTTKGLTGKQSVNAFRRAYERG